MDENFRTKASRITAVYVVFCGFLCFGVGLFALAIYPIKIWYLGILLVPLSFFIVIEGIRLFKKMGREQLISDAERQTIHHLINSNQSSSPTILPAESPGIQHPLGKEALQVNILARWEYTPEQWQQFIRWEKSERKMEIIITMILVILFGTFILRLSREAPWFAAIGVSLIIAILYGAISYAVALNAIKLKSKKATVVITTDAVLVNGHYNRLNGENLWFEKVEMKKADQFSYLEFVTGSTIRTGKTTHELRIPVPHDQEIEAAALVAELNTRRKPD